MTAAEKLKSEGLGKPAFTKDQLIESVSAKIRKCGHASYIIGRHVSTDFDRDTIGDCNPYNRQYLEKWLMEEGFHWESRFNGYGMESIRVTL